jgi:hypothetical protein
MLATRARFEAAAPVFIHNTHAGHDALPFALPILLGGGPPGICRCGIYEEKMQPHHERTRHTVVHQVRQRRSDLQSRHAAFLQSLSILLPFTLVVL